MGERQTSRRPTTKGYKHDRDNHGKKDKGSKGDRPKENVPPTVTTPETPQPQRAGRPRRAGDAAGRTLADAAATAGDPGVRSHAGRRRPGGIAAGVTRGGSDAHSACGPSSHRSRSARSLLRPGSIPA